jgi:Cof subfamily protein (haloacid dehalogenase superfamily)
MRRPRLLVLDLDGTTLTHDKQVLERDRVAARELRARGVHVTVATGRLFAGTQPSAQALGVQGSVAVMNGSELIDVDTGELRLGRYLSPASTGAVRMLLAESGLHGVIFRSGGLHFGRRSMAIQPYLSDWGERHEIHEDLHVAEAWQAADLLSIGVVGSPSEVTALRSELEPMLAEGEGVVEFDTHSGERFLSLRHRGEDKGTALLRLAEERGVAVEDTVAVGDWLNDVPMFRAAGRSFCMSGAEPEVTGQADEVLETRRHAGGAVAEVAERVWGLRI